jgi:hypothetical protein
VADSDREEAKTGTDESLQGDNPDSPGPHWTPEEATQLADDIHLGNHAVCPACSGWVQGTIVTTVASVRKPVDLECEGCGRRATAYGSQDNQGRRVEPDDGWKLEDARRRGASFVCPFCSAAMRLLRDELPDGREIFAFDCLACGASYYEAGGVL